MLSSLSVFTQLVNGRTGVRTLNDNTESYIHQKKSVLKTKVKNAKDYRH
jgi:hypothetical protein